MIYRLLIFLLLCTFAVAGELVTNGDFVDWDDADTPTGWTNSPVDANKETQQQNPGDFHNGPGTGALNIWRSGGGSEMWCRQDSILTIGSTYRITFDAWVNSGKIRLLSWNIANVYAVFSTSGLKVRTFVAVDEGIAFATNADPTDITIDNISIIEADSLNCYVGGSSASTDNAGWSNLSAADSVGADGQSLYEDTLLGGVSEGSGGKVLITTDIDLTDITGVFCYVFNFDGAEAPGRYEIIAVNTVPAGADTILINLDFINSEDCDIVIGGAIPESYSVVGYDLEGVLDDNGIVGPVIAGGGDVNFYITGTTDTDESITVDNIEGANNNWVRLIGSDTSYDPTDTRGTQGWTITGGAALTGDGLLKLVNKERIQVKNVAFSGNNENEGGPIAFDYGLWFPSGSNQYDYLVENCSFDDCYKGIHINPFALGVVIKDCTVGETTVCENDCIENDAAGTVVVGGYYKAAASQTVLDLNASTTIRECIFVEGARGIQAVLTGLITIDQCDFYNHTTGSLNFGASVTMGRVTNNIFYVADPANDYAIQLTSGSYTEYNNITNANTLALSGFINSTGYNLNFTNTDPFVDASGGDFRINWGNTIANTYVIDQGYAPYLGANTTGSSKANIGAFNYQQAKGRHRSIIRKGN